MEALLWSSQSLERLPKSFRICHTDSQSSLVYIISPCLRKQTNKKAQQGDAYL